MNTFSGRLAFKLIILTASAAASIILISACEKSPQEVVKDHPSPTPSPENMGLIVCMYPPGVEVRASSEDVEKEFKRLIAEHGEQVCKVDYYKKDRNIPDWSHGHGRPCMTNAVRAEAAGSPASVDPMNLVQRVQFANLDEAQKSFSTINSSPTPSPAPSPTPPLP